MVSTFRNIIEFFDEIGIYDVILPFLLIFTIVFAILEKTKIFGTEEVDGVKYTKKNLNSMAAFVIAFMVIASSKLVELITQVSSQVVILLLLSIFFLLLVGSFFKEGEGVFLEGGWKIAFMVIMFLGILGIFLQAIQTKHGEPWLEWFWDYMVDHWTSTGVGSIILALVVIGIMMYVVMENKSSAKKTEEEKKE
ncbi:MAG: hypothetical protein KAU20_01205 [Nanoarchaeota archaeon]|nr:hypothetical protein [Nanoarchaeota archaeon]